MGTDLNPTFSPGVVARRRRPALVQGARPRAPLTKRAPTHNPEDVLVVPACFTAVSLLFRGLPAQLLLIWENR